ncbi:MAG: hypothetical protein GEU74_12405, partial [Nitriliruptorales bacterium]|nr:hypothetical protein [Nitriliruptorales bacterium]
MGIYDNWDDKPEPPPTGPTRAPTRRSETSPYGRKALDSELGRLATATEGTRNDTLNRVAFNIVQLVNAGHVEADEAYTALGHTARMIGLTPHEITATMRSAHNGATGKPRTNAPAPDAHADTPAPTVLRVISGNDDNGTPPTDNDPDDLTAWIDEHFPPLDW